MKSHYINKSKFLILLFIMIGNFVVVNQVYAEKVLFFTPTRVHVNDNDKVEVINVSNLSNIARSYSISIKDLVMTSSGVTKEVDNFDYSAKRLVRYVPRTFTLQPGERQAIRIMSRVPPDMPDGDYHSHLKFLEDVSKRDELNSDEDDGVAKIDAYFAYSAMIPVIVSHGKVETKISLKSAVINKSENGKISMTVDLSREGNGQGVAYIDTHLEDSNGNKIEVTPRRTVYIYREIPGLVKDYEFDLPEDVSGKGNLVVSVYDSQDKDAVAVGQETIPLSD